MTLDEFKRKYGNKRGADLIESLVVELPKEDTAYNKLLKHASKEFAADLESLLK